MGDKHSPNSWTNYVETHTTVMGQFVDVGFVLADDLTSSPYAGYLYISGTIRCLGGLQIDVGKSLDVWRQGSRFMVQTFTYSYNVSIATFGNVFRYDSPHQHRPQHHRHTYQWNVPDDSGTIESSTDGDWPTLGNVIGETRMFYWQHHDELPMAA